MNTQNNPKRAFSDETIASLKELGNILLPVYLRMREEGYDIIDGKIVNVETGEEFKSN